MRIELPRGVKLITERMRAHGYRADIVGGCVRDIILGRTPADFDITTNASPEEVESVFSDMRVIETGIKHGTVTVISDGEPYEITTYRIDGDYNDSRHPDSVEFTDDITADLARRDFTVNAMAYSDEYGLTDVYGGKEDLERGLIRAVGSAECRFREDALRILRAIRFSSVLNFEIEASTAKAVHREKRLLHNVSAERIFVELKKLISGKGAYRVLRDYSDVIAEVLPELSNLVLPPEREFCEMSPEERAASVFLLSSDVSGWLSAAKRLKSDNRLRDRIRGIISSVPEFSACDRETVGEYLIGKRDECLNPALNIAAALGIIDVACAEYIRELAASGIPRSVSELEVDGEDLKALGIHGEKIGKTLSCLLSDVASGRLPCNRKSLLFEATKYI